MLLMVRHAGYIAAAAIIRQLFPDAVVYLVVSLMVILHLWKAARAYVYDVLLAKPLTNAADGGSVV